MSDAAAAVTAQVTAALASQSLGDDYDYAVTWAPAADLAGQQHIAWMILITTRHPLLGHPPMGITATLAVPAVPPAAAVTEAVKTAVAGLRDAYRAEQSKVVQGVSAGNGHGPSLIKRE